MKRCIILSVIFISIIVIPINAYADEYDENLSAFDLSSFELLDSDTKKFLEENKLDGFRYEDIYNLSISDTISYIKSGLLKSVKTPLEAGAVLIVFIILSSLFKSMNSDLRENDLSVFYTSVASLITAVFLASKITDCINVSQSTIKLCSDFSYGFFPVFCLIVATSGGVMTSFAVNTLLLTLSQFMNFISEVIFVPGVNCLLALGICSGVNSEVHLSSLTSTVKKVLTTLISSLSALFVSILSIKTSVASKADALGLRSMRFAINTVVPVVGPSISEGLISIQSYSSLVKTGVGIVGIISIFSLFVPALSSVISWRFILLLCNMTAEIFDDGNSSLIINAFRDVMLLIEVLLILSMLTTVISLGILVAARTVE